MIQEGAVLEIMVVQEEAVLAALEEEAGLEVMVVQEGVMGAVLVVMVVLQGAALVILGGIQLLRLTSLTKVQGAPVAAGLMTMGSVPSIRQDLVSLIEIRATLSGLMTMRANPGISQDLANLIETPENLAAGFCPAAGHIREFKWSQCDKLPSERTNFEASFVSNSINDGRMWQYNKLAINYESRYCFQ